MTVTYRQYDARWGNIVYTQGGSTLAHAGCGDTSVAMLATNNPKYANVTPKDVVPFMKKHGYNYKGTTWDGITKGLEHYGFVTARSSNAETIFKWLDGGFFDRGIINFEAGRQGGVTWTSSGHYVVFSAYEKRGNKHWFYTRDPGMRKNDGWHCFEKTMSELIRMIFVCYLPSEHKKPEVIAPKKKPNVKCIDVSEAQAKIDWKKVKADGIEYAIIRAGYGWTHVDKWFEKNIKGAHEAGLKIGIYWFGYAYKKEHAIKEAEGCLKTIKPYKKWIDLPVFYDWEYDSMKYARKHGVNPKKSLITAFNKLFCDKIKAAGYKTGFYYNLDYKKNYLNLKTLKSYYKWLAYYTKTKQKNIAIQQYTNKGKVDGISGKVDRDWIIDKKLL